MIFTIILGGLFAGIVFFHYVQGFFSSTISAFLAIFAAVLAFSWHESVVEALLGGKAANVADSLVLIALFAGIYLGLRTLFDKFVPNGIMLPAIVDKIGGGVMGAVAAIFGLGILAIAIEELPMGTNVVGFTRYDAEDNQRRILENGKMKDVSNSDELKSTDAGSFDEKDRQQLFPMVIPGVDEIVVGTVKSLSETGAMQGTPLSQIHPDFLQEIYGQNIGIQAGTKHVMLPAWASVAGVFKVGEVNVVDSELGNVRGGRAPVVPLNINPHVDPATPSQILQTFVADDKHMLIVVRISFSSDAGESDDHFIRLSPGSIRLVARRIDPKTKEEAYHDYYAVGTLEPGKSGSVPVLFSDKPDDYLIVDSQPKGGKPAIDAAFLVEKDGFEKVVVNEEQHSKHPVTKDGMFLVAEDVFVEVKRMFRESLGSQLIKPYVNQPANGLTLGTMHPGEVIKSAAVLPTKGPKIGSVELTFTERSKLSEMKSLCKELNYSQTPTDYELGTVHFLAYVPPKYDPKKPMGLIILSTGEKADELPQALRDHLDETYTALLVPRHPADAWWQRAGLALDAVDNMQQQYAINGNRIYLYGFGFEPGGARPVFMEERLGLTFPQVFSGLFLTQAGNFAQITSAGRTIPAALPTPLPDALALAKQLPIVMVDVEKNPAGKVLLDFFHESGFTKAQLLELDKEQFRPPNIGWLTESLHLLDEGTATLKRKASVPVAK